MKRQIKQAVLMTVAATALPFVTLAQGVADSIHSLQSVLDKLYAEMIPMCSQLIGVGRAMAGFAATWYIAARVWRHIANAEPIDFYPLLRPFAIGIALVIFPSVIGVINGVMQPTVSATAGMVKDSDKAIAMLLEKRQQAMKSNKEWQMYIGEDGSGDRDKWYAYMHPEEKTGQGEGMFESVGNDMKFWMERQAYTMRNNAKQWLSEVLQVLYEAAALCINTIRTFYLIVLAIMGPLVFGLAVFDGFQHTLTVWLGRYINVFLWLPVANIFGSIIGKVQENMLKLDIERAGQAASASDSFFSPTDTAYLVFMIIGIIGYFTVPSVANYIVHAGGGNALLHKVTSMSSGGTNQMASAGKKEAGMIGDMMGNDANQMRRGMAEFFQSSPYFGGGGNNKKGNSFNKNKLSGDS